MDSHGQLPGKHQWFRGNLRPRRGTPGGRAQRARLTAAAAVVMLAAAACGGGGSASSVKQGGVFRLGSPSSIDSLNPFVAFQGDAYTTFEYIYPELVQYNASLQFVPDFARSWSQSPDGLTWTFHTQPGAKWSDGKPLTAADAAWTYSTILKYQAGATANSAGYVAHMKSATAPNATTLVLTYTKPVANVLSQVQQVPILPEHVWARYATGNGKALTRFSNNAPIVSGGPFTLTKYTPKQIALFKRNPSFYGPKPHVEGFGLQFFQTTDAMITALKSNQLDGVEVPVPPTSVGTLKAAHFVVRSSQGDAFDDFIINSNPKQDASHKELLNPLLRQAFNDAIDRQAIVKTSLLGYGQPGSSIIPPATGHWNNPAIRPATFSLAKAAQLLDQAGYKMGPNGVRIADGHPMSYTVIMPTDIQNGYGQRSFQIIQPDFQKIGVRLNLKILDDSAAYNAIKANSYKSFEISMWDWFPLTDPDFMLSVLTCGSWNVWNDTGYCSTAYDGLYQAQSAATSPAKRQQIVYQMQQMAASSLMYLVLDYPASIEAHSPSWSDLPLIAGSSFTSMSKIPFESVHQAG
ncbi:MAG: peptide/nickel transport system substrate-binding protein [Streptosporangiaceae bacterium]|jgi:peptide/nickel transport system substrate-binding protein|nr:peptide/nickel transport system substrate-binding protein [Streptosporangiaceae bacterium]